MRMNNKKAAIEMSLSTIITIVLSVVFLILALIVLRNMYEFQTESVGAVQDKTLAEINKLYLSGDEDTNKISISLGSEKLAKVRAGTETFGVEIAAGTISGARIQNGSDLQFKLWLDETAPTNCVKIIGKTATTAMVASKLDTWLNSERFADSAGGIVVYLSIPPATRTCTQKIYVQARDKTTNPEGEIISQDFFTLQVLRKSPFG